MGSRGEAPKSGRSAPPVPIRTQARKDTRLETLALRQGGTDFEWLTDPGGFPIRPSDLVPRSIRALDPILPDDLVTPHGRHAMAQGRFREPDDLALPP